MTATSEQTEPPQAKQNTGRIEEIQGVVIEAVFPDKLPEIYHAITVKRPEAARAEEDEDIAASKNEWLVCEVQQHLGGDRHRCTDHGPRRAADAWTDLQPARRADRSWR